MKPVERFRRATWSRFPFEGAEQLRALRMAAGLSVAEAAAWVGVTVRTWRAWERAQRPTPAACRHLMAVLAGVPPWPAWERFALVEDDALENLEDPSLRVHPDEVLRFVYSQAIVAEARARLKALDAEPDFPQLALFRRR